MPTPFTHLEIAQRLLDDPELPERFRSFLRSQAPAWLLGNVAADARVGSGAPRETTHFYDYRTGIHQHPWRVMVDENPELMCPKNPAHQSFIAGYIAHLSVDEIWSIEMVGPHFAQREWADQATRFYMLHIILIYMDERDLAKLESWQSQALCSAEPDHWLAFMPDDDLRAWQTLIYDQIKPGGESETLEIFGGRINRTPEELRSILDVPEEMQSRLWDHIPVALLNEIMDHAYQHARRQVLRYFLETNQTSSP